MPKAGASGPIHAAPALDATGVLPPGFRLVNRYRIVKPLAAGGFGITYLAEHEGLAKAYAIKEHFPREFASRDGSSVRPNTADTAIFGWALKRFAEEARKLAKFKHPAIVDVVDVFEGNGTAYMVMSFEPGTSLAKWLDGLKRAPTQAEIDALAAPLLDALEVMHGASILHRDIAPDNIMVRPDGSPCLIDFGAARQAMGQQTKTLTAIVKAGYSPVEQYDTEGTEAQGPWTDIYALAATLYRAVTGSKPPEAPGRLIADRCRRASDRPASGLRPSFLSAVDQGLGVLPKSRPQSIAQWRPLLIGIGARQQASSTQRWEPPPIAHPSPHRAASPAPTISSPQSLSVAGGLGTPPDTAPAPRRRSGLITGAVVLAVGLAILGGVWLLRQPIFDQMAESEYARIASSTETTVFEEFQKKHPGTNAARKAEARIADLKSQQAGAATRTRHAAAASEWARVKDTTDEQVIERFIAAHGDAPVVAEARARLAKLRADSALAAKSATAASEWERLKATEDEAAIERFLATYGDTTSAAQARARLAEIRQEKARITAAASEWSRIKHTTDEALIERFIAAHRDTPAAGEARTRLASLREQAAARQRAQGPHVLSATEERALRPRDEFQECDVCPRMVVVPAGRFDMGSPPDEKDRDSDEGPVHEVTIAKAFAVGKLEVTFAEWEACAADGGCQSNRSPSDSGWGRGTRPVINVSWSDAQEYVAWLKRKTGKSYRLLTEAEWKYAARAGTRTPFHTGVTITTDQANYDGNFTYGPTGRKGEYRKQTVSVGSFPANAFGLHDMHGNVWEWVEDCWVDNYNGAPNDGTARTTGDCSRRVLRGGSWFSLPRILRSASRIRLTTVSRDLLIGYRLGRTLTP